MVSGLKPVGKPSTKGILKSFGQNQGIAWSSDSSLWGNQVQKEILTSSGQNQGLAWSSDPSLWGNQLLKRRNWVTWVLWFCPRILNTKGASMEWRNAFPKARPKSCNARSLPRMNHLEFVFLIQYSSAHYGTFNRYFG